MKKDRLDESNLLQFESRPYGTWLAGFIIFLIGTYLIYHVTLGQYFGVVLIPESCKPRLVHYVTAVGIFALGIGFLLSGRIE
jgi:hypothetical protein